MKPSFLAAPDDDCALCGHPWHGEQDRPRCRICGCWTYRPGPLF